MYKRQLFNIYTSDIPSPPEHTHLITYADDITITTSHQDHKTAQEKLQPYINTVTSWASENNLSIHPDKTTATLFTPHPAEYNDNLNIPVHNKVIPTQKRSKILGLTFDPKLTYSEHVKTSTDKAKALSTF